MRFCKKVTIAELPGLCGAIDVLTRGFVHVPVGTLFFKHPQMTNLQARQKKASKKAAAIRQHDGFHNGGGECVLHRSEMLNSS